MKTNLLKILSLPVVLALLLAGCSVDDPDHPTGLQAPPVFSSYVALGNSLTAGYMDSGLMLRGQLSSYPSMIAGQLGLGDGFSQPLVDRPGIGSTDVGAGNIAGVLAFNPTSGAIAPLGITPAAQVPGLLLNATQLTPYHNLGVPGITLADLFNGYSSVNSQSHSPFLDFINRYSLLYGNEERFATLLDLAGEEQRVSYQTCSTGWQAVAKGPTVATVWIGNNDVLGGATGGNPTVDNMTPPSVFAALYNEMLQLLAGGLLQRTGFPAVIAVGNIPDVVDAAYFISEATFEAAAGGAWPWGYEEGGAELLTFPVLSWVSDAANQGTAIPSRYTLTNAEVTLVNQYVAGYNQAISNIVNGINAAGVAQVGLADMNSTLRDLPDAQKTHFMLLLGAGMDVETAAATTAFSLDGVHPNNRGYAIAANAFIDVINTVAGTEVETVDPSAYTWDPTYTPAGKARPAAGPAPHLTPEAAAAMAAIWQ